MSEKMPIEIWAKDFDAPQYKGEFFKYEPNDVRAGKYHRDDIYLAEKQEKERLQKVHKELLSIYNKNLNLCATLQVDIIKLSEEIKRLRGQLGYIASFNNVDEEVALKMKKIAMKALEGK